MDQWTPSNGSSRSQFSARATHYNSRTVWINDEELTAAFRSAISGTWTGARCVDLGTGTGALVRQAEKFGCWIGVDTSIAMLQQSRLDRAIGGAAESMPIRDSSMDLVAARSVLCYTDIGKTYSEISRILRPNGRCVILEKVIGKFYGRALDWLRTLESARNPLKQGLRSTENLVELASSHELALVKKRELHRLYSQSYLDWLAAIPGDVNQKRVRRIVSNAPAEANSIGFQVSDDGFVSLPTTWAVLEFERRLS